MNKLLLLLTLALGACATDDSYDSAANYFSHSKNGEPHSSRSTSSRLPRIMDRDAVLPADAVKIPDGESFDNPSATFGLSPEFSLAFVSANGKKLDSIAVAAGDWNHEFSSFKSDIQGRIFSSVEEISGDSVKSLELVMGDSVKTPGLYDHLSHINFGYVRIAEERADEASAKYLPYAFGFGVAQTEPAPGAVFRGRAIAGISSTRFDGTDAKFMELVGTAQVEVDKFGVQSVAVNFPSYYTFHFENGELFMQKNANVGVDFALNAAYFYDHSLDYEFFGRIQGFSEEVGGIFSISQAWDRIIEINGAFGAKRDIFSRKR